MGLRRFLSGKKSGNIAKNRLKFLLISDRCDCSPEILEKIKNDIIEDISKDIVINTDEMEIEITKISDRHTGKTVPSLWAAVPIVDIRKEIR